MVEDVWIMAGKGIDGRHEMNVSRAGSPAKAADTIRDPCWQCPDLTWEHSLVLSSDARGRAICLMRTFGIPKACSSQRGESTAQRGVFRMLLANGFVVARRWAGHEPAA
jgi:hypothetical protein